MSQADAIEAMLKSAIAEFGTVDVLVNNAGVQSRRADRRVPGPQIGCDPRAPHDPRRAAHHERGLWARIVNVASAHALVASSYRAACVAAKHGMAGDDRARAVARPLRHARRHPQPRMTREPADARGVAARRQR
jgi:3-hydroxybutyrate dehydrogenase